MLTPLSGMAPALVLSTPYVVQHADLAQWQAYLQRNTPKTKISDPQGAYAGLMKHGLASNYWADYVFEAYSGHSDNAVFIVGLPDVAKSRPHAMVNW